MTTGRKCRERRGQAVAVADGAGVNVAVGEKAGGDVGERLGAAVGVAVEVGERMTPGVAIAVAVTVAVGRGSTRTGRVGTGVAVADNARGSGQPMSMLNPMTTATMSAMTKTTKQETTTVFHMSRGDMVPPDRHVPAPLRSYASLPSRTALRSAMGTRICSILSRSRMVTARSSRVCTSTVTQYSVPISSCRRYRRPIEAVSS